MANKKTKKQTAITPQKKEEKVFKIEKVAGRGVRLQVNNANFWLEDRERGRLAICFNKAMDMGGMPFPMTGHATYITYDNGITAVLLTVARLQRDPTSPEAGGGEFIFTIMYQVPGNLGYATDSFYADRGTMDAFLNVLVDGMADDIAVEKK